MGNKTLRQKLTEEGFCTIKFLLDKGWNQYEVSKMTDYSNQVVSKVARVDSLDEYKMKYKQPGGTEYRKMRERKQTLMDIISYSCDAFGYSKEKRDRLIREFFANN